MNSTHDRNEKLRWLALNLPLTGVAYLRVPQVEQPHFERTLPAITSTLKRLNEQLGRSEAIVPRLKQDNLVAN